MDYVDDLYSKANHIFGIIALIFVILLVFDTLIFTLIPITYFKIIGVTLLVLAIIGYGSNMWLQHYENYVCMSLSPKDYLWTFRNFLDDYRGKTYRDYGGGCDNYDAFEDAMEEFSELFDSDHQDHFGKTMIHFKHMYKYADDNATKNKAKQEADKFLNKKYAQLLKFEKHHNHQKLWSLTEKNDFNHIPFILSEESRAMDKVVEA